MKPNQFFALADFTSLSKNNMQPIEKQVVRLGTLQDDRAVFRLHYTVLNCEEMLLSMTPKTGPALNILLEKHPALPPANRRQMVEAGEGFLFTDPTAPAGVDLWEKLDYVPDINAPDGNRYVRVLETHGTYKETPSRDGLAGVELIASLGIYEAELEDLKGTFLVTLEIGTPTCKDGGLIILYQGRSIDAGDIEPQ